MWSWKTGLKHGVALDVSFGDDLSRLGKRRRRLTRLSDIERFPKNCFSFLGHNMAHSPPSSMFSTLVFPVSEPLSG